MSEKLPQLGCVELTVLVSLERKHKDHYFKLELTVLVSLQKKHRYHYFKYNMHHVRQTTTTRMC